MSGPQRLAGNGIEPFGNTVPLPALNDFQRPTIGGEDGVTQRPILLIEEKEALTLSEMPTPLICSPDTPACCNSPAMVAAQCCQSWRMSRSA